MLMLGPKELEERPGGNASLFALIISEKFLAQQQFIPLKPMDLWCVEYRARGNIPDIRCRAKFRSSPAEFPSS
jgi:hypothetical protein